MSGIELPEIDEELFNIVHNGVTYEQVSEDWIIKKFGSEAPALLHETSKAEALKGVDEVHAKLMRELTGGATVEERDTWQAKELAARAVKNSTATETQTNMLATEASYTGVTIDALADKIIEKADKYYQLIGLASGIRAKARKRIEGALNARAIEIGVATSYDDVADAMELLNGS